MFGALFMNKKRLRKQVLFIFSFIISPLGFTQTKSEKHPGSEDSDTQAMTSSPKTPDIKAEDCTFISETYRKAIAKHHIKELPSPEQEKQNPFDVRLYEELLQKLGVSDQSYYTQAGLKDDFENLRHPGSWNRLSKDEENRSQEIMARHLKNFRKCLDQSISTIKKEYSQLSFESLDPVAKELFKGLKATKQNKTSDQELKSNKDIISYFNEKLNYYTGLCQKANIPPFIADTISPEAYQAFMLTWQQDHFGQGTLNKLKLKKATTNENPFDGDFLQLNLIPKQIFGSDFEIDKKGDPYFRVSSCVTGECEKSLEKTLSEINKDPAKKEALERSVYAYTQINKEIEEAISKEGDTAQAFQHFKGISQENGLEFSYDAKTDRIRSDPRLFSEVLHKSFSEIQNEKDPTKRKELLKKHFPSIISLQILYGQQSKDRYLSYYGLENKDLTKENQDQFRALSDKTVKKEAEITEEIKKQKDEIFSVITKKDDEEFHKALENPILSGEASSKTKSGFSFFPKEPEEIATRSKEITKSLDAVKAKTSKLNAQKELAFHIVELSSLQNELIRIQKKKDQGKLLSSHEIKNERDLARDIKLLLDKTLPNLDKKDQEEARKSIEEWNRAYANKSDPKKMIEISRTWPIEKWIKNTSKFKTLDDENEKLANLFNSYLGLKQLGEQQLASYELLQEKKPKTIILGDQALVPISPDKASDGFKVIPAFGSSPQSLETQLSEISHDLDKDLKSLHIAKLRYKGFEFDENSKVPLEQQIANQSDSPLSGMGLGFADIGYGIKDMITLQPIKAGPTTQKYLNNQSATNNRIQETIEKARELGLPRHSLLQTELGLPQSMESLATDEKSNAAYRFALDSFYSDAQGNYKSAMGAMASLPLGGAASAGGRFLVNYARIARLTAAAETGAGAATGLRGATTALVRAPVRTTAAQALSEISLQQALKESALNMGMLTMFSGVTTGLSNVNEAIQKRDASSLTKNWGHVIAGAFDPHMAIYAGFPAITEPLGKSAAAALANKGLSKTASAGAEQLVHHGYWTYLGIEGYREQEKHLGDYQTNIAEEGTNFSAKRENLQTGFITNSKDDLEFNPEEAQKQSADAIQSINNMKKEYKIADVNKWIHAGAGIGIPVRGAIRGTIKKNRDLRPALSTTQALKEIGIKDPLLKGLSPEGLSSYLKENPDIQQKAEYYLDTSLKNYEIDAIKDVEAAERAFMNKLLPKKSLNKKIADIKTEYAYRARSARITADLAKGEYRSVEEHPLYQDTPQLENEQNVDSEDKGDKPICCGVSDQVKVDLKND